MIKTKEIIWAIKNKQNNNWAHFDLDKPIKIIKKINIFNQNKIENDMEINRHIPSLIKDVIKTKKYIIINN